MKKIIIPFLLILFAFNASAQTEYDSIRNVIEQYKGASNIIIPNIREMMMAKLDSNDIAGARKLYNYTVNVLPRQQNIMSFFDTERLMLAYVLNDERFLLEEMQQLNNGTNNNPRISLSQRKRYQYPSINDDLWKNLAEYSLLHFEETRKQIAASTQLSKEEADVLMTYYRFMLRNSEDERFSVWRIEKEINEKFGKDYSGKYQYLVNTEMLENITPTKLHFTFEVGIGATFRGKDIKHYVPVMAGADIRTGVEYKKAIFEVGFHENGAKLRKSLNVKNETWETDSSVLTHNLSTTIGYFVVDNARLALYPFAGATMAWMQPEYNGPTQSKRTVMRSNAGLVTGVALQYKMKKWGYRYSTRKGGDFYTYFGLRLSYLSRNFTDPAIKTNAFQCTVSIMGDFGERLFPLPWTWFNGTRKGGGRR